MKYRQLNRDEVLALQKGDTVYLEDLSGNRCTAEVQSSNVLKLAGRYFIEDDWSLRCKLVDAGEFPDVPEACEVYGLGSVYSIEVEEGESAYFSNNTPVFVLDLEDGESILLK